MLTESLKSCLAFRVSAAVTLLASFFKNQTRLAATRTQIHGDNPSFR